jgi:AraC-like DNA-binding protein
VKPRVRNAALHGYVELTRALGADPLRLMRSVGLDASVLGPDERWISEVAVDELRELTAQVTACESFGLRLAEVRRFSYLGPVSLAARDEPDVRSALRLLIRYLHLHTDGVRARLSEANGVATIEIDVAMGTPTSHRQTTELAVGMCLRTVAALRGSDWKPASVWFTHSAPTDLETHHRVLGPNVEFDQELNGLILYSTDLDAPNALAEPLLRPYTRQVLEAVAAEKGAPGDQPVRDLIQTLLPSGRCSIKTVARALDVDPRTLQRHLAKSGQTFSSVMNDVRVDLAQRQVPEQDTPLIEVAQTLGFAAQGTFSRWFRAQFGTSPSQWRAGARPPPEAQGPAALRPAR